MKAPVARHSSTRSGCRPWQRRSDQGVRVPAQARRGGQMEGVSPNYHSTTHTTTTTTTSSTSTSTSTSTTSTSTSTSTSTTTTTTILLLLLPLLLIGLTHVMRFAPPPPNWG